MKKKEIISIIIIAIVLAVLISGAVYLSMIPRMSKKGVPINFFPAYNGKVYIYNNSVINTENITVSDVDIDLTEFGVHSTGIINIGNIDALTLYLSAYSDGKTRFFGMNLLTGKIFEILFESSFEVFGYNNRQFYVSSGYLYYFAWNIPEDGSFENVNDSFCRVPLTGGREEVIAEFPHFASERTTFSFVADGMAFFCDAENISVCDPDTGKIEILWSAEDNGYNTVNRSLTYYDGLIYFLASSEPHEEIVPEDPDFFADITSATSSYLFSLNPKNKKVTLVTAEPINCFYIADNRIYYIPKALGTVQIGDQIMPRYSAEEVYSLDLKGRNKEKVCSFNGIFVYDIIYMNESIICIHDYYGETFRTSYCIIDRQTGEVTRVKTNKN